MAAISLVAGVITFAGLDAQRAAAAAPAPVVTASASSTYIAGEDTAVTLRIASADAGDQFNLSVGVVLPEGVTVRDSGGLGTPIVYPVSATDRVVPGTFADCSVVGLEPRTGGVAGCQVPLGVQYLVFPNISDLPDGAAVSHTLSLRPDAAIFPVGSTDLRLAVSAFTSDDERLLPTMPGVRSAATTTTHTSAAGVTNHQIPVQALRLEKSEPSPESELLRGVHSNTTTYTLRVWRSGEGDLGSVVVTDFLPAGLEYLGRGGVDNSTDANGTAGTAAEYPGAASLAATPAPAGSTPNALLEPGVTETVETVIPSASDVAAYGLEAGKVYTKVTWTIGALAAAGTALDIEAPLAQSYPTAAGEPGLIELRYRAGIPLFENTLDFDGAGGQPATSGAQKANLDNNRGASTRHGSVATSPGYGDDGSANALTNIANAAGVYAGAVAPGGSSSSSDTAEFTVDAVDVRVLKSVDDEEFRQGQNARYSLIIRTSEYASAELGSGGSSSIRPNRLVDDLADGICPVLPAAVAVTPGASSTPGVPRLVLGDPGPGGTVGPELSAADWSAALGALGSECTFPSSSAGAELTGATLSGIAFDPTSGHFFLDLAVAPISAGAETVVTYTARQNALYIESDGAPGATSSGDTVTNSVELMMSTTSIPALAGVVSAGDAANGVPADVADGVWRAWDDSAATLRAGLTRLTKHVLQRDAGVTDGPGAAAAPEAEWVKVADEAAPFAVGDEVWYRIKVIPPTGADVRNPKLTDFLPDGVSFDSTLKPNGRHADIWVTPSSPVGLGTCQPADAAEWLDTFVPADQITVNENVITFALGSSDCVDDGTNDRFLPLDTTLEIYLKVTVVDPAAFGEVDIPQNLAKYQQNNVDGEIFFLRDQAEIAVDGGAGLVKGIRSITSATGTTADNTYTSNVDGTPTSLTVVHGDQVTFRLDITGPRVETSDYAVWDALPVGVSKADLLGIDPAGTFTSASAATITQTWIPATPTDPGFWGYSETPVSNGWTATAYDPTDAGYPADVRPEIRDAGRSVIVFAYSGVVPGSIAPDDSFDPDRPGAVQGLTLGYTVVIPDGSGASTAAQLSQRYLNDASIVGFSYENNSASRTPIIVNSDESVAVDRTPSTGQFLLEDEDGVTSDPSSVYVPDTTPTKRLVSTEVGPLTPLGGADGPVGLNARDAANGQAQIVHGELATFEYAVTIPAHTTVSGAVISDAGSLAYGTAWASSLDYEYVTGSARFLTGAVGTTPITCGTTSSDFRCAETAGTAHGVLTFPDVYTNSTSDAQVFRIQVTMWVSDADASNPSRTPNLASSTSLRNTATFAYDDPNSTTGAQISHDATATVTYVEPSVSITKTASKTAEVAVGDEVTYTLVVANPSGQLRTFDNVLVDTVPDGLSVKAGSFTINGTAIADSAMTYTGGVFAGDGGTITWSPTGATAALADAGAAITLTYIATISETTGGGATYVNDAEVTGHTLPADLGGTSTTARRGDRLATADETITAVTASIEKGVRIGTTGAYAATARAPIGETARYEQRVTLRTGINYYDARITDTLPAGVTLVGTPTVTSTDPTVDANDWTFTAATAPSRTWTLSYVGGDIARAAADRVVVVTYDVLLANTVASGVNSLPNTAAFTWGPRDNAPESDRESVTDDATVTVLNPSLTLAKTVKLSSAADSTFAGSRTGAVDQLFTYRLRVSNAANPSAPAAPTRSPAYNASVTDVVPAGVIIDTTTFTIDGAAATPTYTAGVATGAGGTITWSLDGPINPGSTVELRYQASFVSAATLTSAGKVNTARIPTYTSFPTGGRSYTNANTARTATVTPAVPAVALTKAVADTSRTAYVGEPFGWVLTATNNGTGAAQKVVLTDTLPDNWSFTEVTSITVAGSTVAATNPTGAPEGPLVWTFGADSVSGSPAAILAPGQSIVIRYTATPDNPAALTTPGVGSSNPHVNTLSAVTTDRRNATGLGTGSYTGPDATDNAFLREADLHLVKDAIGGVTSVQTANDNRLRGLAVGTWVAGQSPVTGQYAQPQWRVTVTNQGPDAGFGPFRVIDTTTLPTGVTTGTWTARYFSGAADTVGTPLTLSGAGTSASPFVIGGATTSLAASGADRIVITADVSIAANATPDATATNTASVTGRTYEDPSNLDDNEDPAEKTITAVADLEVVKTVSDPSPGAVGDPIAWGIAVTNRGPAVSLGSTTPITVTDTVPAGVGSVTATSTTDWVATLADGSAIPAAGVGAGTEILWTYQGTSMAVGVTTNVSLSGAILSSHTGALANTATVTRGDTPDPATPNNSSTVSVTPSDATTLDIVKTRVVWDATTSAWVAAASLSPVPQLVPGEPVSYLVSVTNLGPADARGVTIVDEAPAGLTYSSHANVAGTWTRTAGGTSSTSATNVATWSTFTRTGTLAPDASSSFVVTFSTASTLDVAQATVNCVEVTAANWRSSAAQLFDRACDTTASDRIVDLGIEKTHTAPVGSTRFPAGSVVSYTLTATNHGPSATGGPIIVTDELPSGMSYETGTARVSIDGAAATALAPVASGTGGRLLTWTIPLTGLLDVDETIVVTLDVLIDANVRDSVTLTNTATVAGPETEPVVDPNPNSTTDVVTVRTLADVSIVKSVEAGPWVAGTDVEYTLVVTNAGPSAVPATVVDDLPTGLTIQTMTGTGWDCTSVVRGETTGSCSYSSNSALLPVGDSTITVVARIASSVASGTDLENTATVTWTDSTGTGSDDDDEQITVSAVADLALVKQTRPTQDATTWIDAQNAATAGEAVAGTAAEFRILVENVGPSAAVAPLVVVDTLPAGATFGAMVGATEWTPVVDAVANTVTFTRGASHGGLAVGAQALEIVYTVELDADIPDGDVLVNTATFAAATLLANDDTNTVNDSDPATLEVSREVDVRIAKTHDASAVRIGDDLAFEIVVTNDGPSEASDVVVTDTIPAGLEPLVAPGDPVGLGWTVDAVTFVDPADRGAGATIIASYADPLAPGDSTVEPLTILTRVLLAAYSEVVNTAVVAVDETDTDPTNDRADDTVEVPPMVELEIVKRAVGAFRVGERATYTIEVTNHGPTEDPGAVVVTDVLPAGLTFHSASSDRFACVEATGTVTCTLDGVLDVAETEGLQLHVMVGDAAFPSVENVATVATPSELLPESVTRSAVTVQVAERLATTGYTMPIALAALALLSVLAGAAFIGFGRRRRA